MFYGNTVKDTRQLFFTSWSKYLAHEPLLPIEQQIVAVIKDHPEYHQLLETSAADAEQTYYPELGQTNPFLHMGLHLTIRDQVVTDRPQGIRRVFEQLLSKHHSALSVEHHMMECLAEALWQAQRNGSMPDEAAYLSQCTSLLSSKK